MDSSGIGGKKEIIQHLLPWPGEVRAGQVFTWGRGSHGQLGHGDEENQHTPKVVAALEGERVVHSVDSVGSTHYRNGWHCLPQPRPPQFAVGAIKYRRREQAIKQQLILYEGILRAKQKGVYKGRKQNIDVEQIKKLKEEGYGATQIARELNIHRDSVYRLLKKGGEK